jgi:anaerobic selenocysteine-containing dehydrogenase
MTLVTSFCRFCPASCGTVVDVVDGRIGEVLGNRRNPLTQGFTCAKGRRAGAIMQGPDRLRSSLVRGADGTLVAAETNAVIGDVGVRLRAIREESGPDSIAVFMGTQQAFTTPTPFVVRAWMRAIGSHKLFSTMTIDQSAKWLVPLRMGEYLGGAQRMDTSDVWMLSGTNPLSTASAGDGDAPLVDAPAIQLRDARRRGLRLIVIDPRRTETAELADVFLQIRPGTDAVLHAGLLHVILADGLQDDEFCAAYVSDLESLRRAVRDATPDMVERVCDVPVADLVMAARMFAGAGRGRFTTGTGANFGPHSNVAEHLAEAVNVVCGRFLREGEPSSSHAVLMGDRAAISAVAPPDRTWERGFRSRVGGHGLIRGELPSSILPDEILDPGSDRIRALVVSGGNPLLALPDEQKARRALESLDLLVVLDPFLTETARLATHVVTPTMSYERADHTILMESTFSHPYAAYTPPIVDAPEGAVDDWVLFYETAVAMGVDLKVGGRVLDGSVRPTTEQMLDIVASRGRLDLDDLRAAPDGMLVSRPTSTVQPRGDDPHRFELVPADVEAEIAAALRAVDVSAETFVLICRRQKETMNSLGRGVESLAKRLYNPAFLHPDDMLQMGIEDGRAVRISTEHGFIVLPAHGDLTLRRGTVSITHGYSGETVLGRSDGGANVNRLTSASVDVQSINVMPLFTALPVAVERFDESS